MKINFLNLIDILGVFMVEISVVMPAYNAIEFLDEAINSIINQSFKDLEIICVDDGSTDNTLEVLQGYASKDDRIQVYHQENQGAGGATNTGISKAKGKYIYLMDADDILDLHALEELYNIMEEKDLDFVIFKAISYDEDTKSYYEHDYYTMSLLHEVVGDSVFHWRDIGNRIFHISVTPWCKLYRHDLIKRSGAKFPLHLIYHDNIFFYEILFNSNRLYFYDKFLYTRRVHSSSLVNSHNEKNVHSIETNNLIIKTFMDYGYFEDYKYMLYNRKIHLVNFRYQLVKDEFKEYYFTETKKDYVKIIGHEKYEDFYSSLIEVNRALFDNVINSDTHVEYDLRNEISQLKRDKVDLEKNKKNLESTNTNLQNEINSLKKKNKKLNNKNKKLNKKINDLNKFNESLLSSNSWKLTKSFRTVGNFLRKL